MIKRLFALALALLTSAGLLAGCSSGGDKAEKVFTVASNMNLTTMAPWQSVTDGDWYMFYQIYSRLIDSDSLGHYYPDLAETWECADDGRTWTFHLSKDFNWQRGNDLFKNELVPVTAEDVKYSFEYVMNPANACTRLEDLTSTIESIEVIDDNTIRFVTKDVDVLFEYKVATIMIQPKRAGDEGFDLTKSPVGSGPFKWESSIVDTQVVLAKNEDYFIKPNLDKVIFKFISESSVAAIALANGEVDHVTDFAYSDVPTVENNGDISVYPGSAVTRWTGMNVTHELFADVNVRRAMAHFIDMDALVAAAYPDDASGVVQAVRAYGQIPPGLPGYAPERMKAVTPAFDPDAGHELMAAAGWTRNASGFYEKDGKTFTFDLQVGTNDPVRQNCAVIMSNMLRSQGIDCTARAVEWGTHLSDLTDGNCPMYIIGGFAGLDGCYQIMHTDNSGAFNPNPGYSNPEVDALLEEAWRTVDSAKREELITKAQETWLYDTVFMPMYYAYGFSAINNRITDFNVSEQYPGIDNVGMLLVSRQRNVDISE